MTRKSVFLAIAIGAFLSVQAQGVKADSGRHLLGIGRMFDNDVIGDGHDRWRTGSYTFSLVTGPSWDGTLPHRIGQLLEFRLEGQIISPANLTHPAANDRRYAGMLSFGLHSQFAMGRTEASAGIDMVVTGPQTGLGQFQSYIHKRLGLTPPTAVLPNQIGNAVYPTFRGELARKIALRPGLTLRPFVSAEAGVETLVRAGSDIVLGHFGEGEVMVRDGVTGQRYRAVRGKDPTGTSLVLGGDIAHVFASQLLPSGGPAPRAPTRVRLRAGLNWEGARASAFYGVTWLSKEFTTQPEGQVVGSLHITFRF